MSTTDPLSPAILQYIDTGAFPREEAVFASTLDGPALQALLTSLRAEQNGVRADLRRLSRAEAGRVDGWIARAQQLQADIARSTQIAREIVEEVESLTGRRERARDDGEKAGLLEREVRFYGALEDSLVGVGQFRARAEETRGLVRAEQLEAACGRLRAEEEELERLSVPGASGLRALLEGEVEEDRTSVRSLVKTKWDAWLAVNAEQGHAIVHADHNTAAVVDAAIQLDMLNSLVAKFAKDVEKILVRPRMAVSRQGTVCKIATTGAKISCVDESEDTSTSALFQDLTRIVDFLAAQLPQDVAIPMSQHLVPALAARLEEDWLEPGIPLDVTEMPEFQALLDNTSSFIRTIAAHQWHSAQSLRDWINNAPRSWLAKRREVALGEIRNLVFTGLRETKIVERVERLMLGKTEVSAEDADPGADDAWDTAWDEQGEEEESPVAEKSSARNEEEDTRAWGFDDDAAEAKPTTEADDDEGEAWGWDDGNDNGSKPSGKPNVFEEQSSKPGVFDSNSKAAREDAEKRQVTFRQTYMVTAIPEGLIALIRQVIEDAHMLAGAEYASSPLAPAGTALYTLPTLALAIYRATASTAYSKLDAGSMLIYNDASRLSEQLRAWQAEQDASSRLRLDNDVKTLELFAKRAYTSAMDAQRTVIRDLLDGTQGFSNCTTPPFKATCEAAVDDTTHHLRSVYSLWKPILSESALLQSIGSLLATLTGQIISDVEELPDISEADSKQIKLLCEQVSGVRDLFLQAPPGADGDPRDTTFIYCPTWMKFQYLIEIMESSLADIKYLWTEGELSLEFEVEEVVGLIEALFAESALRRSAIVEVRIGVKR